MCITLLHLSHQQLLTLPTLSLLHLFLEQLVQIMQIHLPYNLHQLLHLLPLHRLHMSHLYQLILSLFHHLLIFFFLQTRKSITTQHSRRYFIQLQHITVTIFSQLNHHQHPATPTRHHVNP